MFDTFPLKEFESNQSDSDDCQEVQSCGGDTLMTVTSPSIRNGDVFHFPGIKFPLVFGNKREPKRFSRNGKRVERIMSKRGRLNIFLSKVPNGHLLKYLRDIGHVLINIRWRWILLTICMANAIAYFIFAVIWMSISWFHGDMSENGAKNESTYCVTNTNRFTGYLLLSIETLTTIGFGKFYPTEECPHGWIILTLQALANLAINGGLVSAVYVKISKPLTKDSRRLFSRRAVICLRDGKLCLIFRICDITEKHCAKTTVSAYFVKTKISTEGENLSSYISQLKLEPHGLLIWPLEIVHVINEESPLWDTAAEDLLSTRFEILAVIGGNSITTGQISQSQTSYLSSEILWGHRFQSCVEFNTKKNCYFINYKQFNQTVCFDTPICSASTLNDIERDIYHHSPTVFDENLIVNTPQYKPSMRSYKNSKNSDIFSESFKMTLKSLPDFSNYTSDYDNVFSD